jgi:hypothetical protein
MFVFFEITKPLLQATMCKITKYHRMPALLLRLAAVINFHFGQKEEIDFSNDFVFCFENNCVDGTKYR